MWGREVGDIRRCLSGRSDHSLTDALFIPYRELKSKQKNWDPVPAMVLMLACRLQIL